MSSSRSDFAPFPVIMGPTASGKTALAIQLALRLNGEVVSADSMQVYRGLDLGTAKPSDEERSGVPHHLIDVADITERYDVFRFCSDAENCISHIRSCGHLPIVAGGTGLYLRALLYGLDPLPASEPLRKELDEAYDNEEHFPELQAIMREKAPLDYERFQHHRRKLIRAYEVLRLTGRQMTLLQKTWKKAECRKDACSFVLVWNNTVLRERIFRRCGKMLASGWIEEAEQFLQAGLHDAPTAWQALGYRQIGEYLKGQLPREELQERIATATWQFARRQNTWFRTQHPEAKRILMPEPRASEIIEMNLRQAIQHAAPGSA